MSNRDPHAATQPHTGRAMGMRGCETREACASDRPGHGINPVQGRLAQATASKWVDGIVREADADGFVTVAELAGGIRRVWHHAPLGETLAPGEPVAVHALYGVLAHGNDRFSVADA